QCWTAGLPSVRWAHRRVAILLLAVVVRRWKQMWEFRRRRMCPWRLMRAWARRQREHGVDRRGARCS
ncbi:hypothetical protein J3F82_003403, partial [Coemansia sp. RSA 637]